MKKIFIDDSECIGCNLCVDLCPSIFKSTEFTPIPTEEDITGNKCAEDSVDFCPVKAIYIK